jgi:hypothetical protein
MNPSARLEPPLKVRVNVADQEIGHQYLPSLISKISVYH